MNVKALVLVAGISAAVSGAGVWVVMSQERRTLMSVDDAEAKVHALSRENYGCGKWRVATPRRGVLDAIRRSEGRPFYDLSGCSAVQVVRLYNPERVSDLNAEIDKARSLSEMHQAIDQLEYMIAKAAAVDMAKQHTMGIDKAFSNWGHN